MSEAEFLSDVNQLYPLNFDEGGYPITSNALPTPIKPGFLSRIGDRLSELRWVIETSSWRDIAFWSGYIILIGAFTGAVVSIFI